MERLSVDNKKQKKIRLWVFLLIMTGFILATLFGWYKMGETRAVQTQLIFHDGNNYLADLYNVVIYAKDGDPYHSDVRGPEEKAYFPLSYVICYPIARMMNISEFYDKYGGMIQGLPSMAIVIGVYVVIIMLALVAIELYAGLKEKVGYKLAFSLCILLSGGMIYSYERGNLILLALAGMLLFVCTYDSENKIVRELGYFGLAFAAALKGYPAILGFLLIYRREWKEVFRLMVYGVVFSFGPFLLLHGGFSNIPVWKSNVYSNGVCYQFSYAPKLGLYYFASYMKNPTPELQARMISVWKPVFVMTGIFGVVTAFFQKKDWIRACMLLCIAMIYPKNCALYCIIYIIPVVLLFLNDEDPKWWEMVFMLFFVLFLSPYQWMNKQTGENVNLILINIGLIVLFGTCVLSNLICLVDLIRKKALREYLLTGKVGEANA